MIKHKDYEDNGKHSTTQKRRPYTKPLVTEYGHIEKITQTGLLTKRGDIGAKKGA